MNPMLPACPVILPLCTAALLAALSKLIKQRLSQAIAILCTLGTALASSLLMRASTVHPIVYWFGNWTPRKGIALGIAFTIEPLGAGLAVFSAILTLAALVYSSQYFDTASNHFHALLLCFLAALSGFCLTGDVFNMFVFFELMSAAGFALCAYKTDDPGSLQGSLNFAVTNTIAAYFVLTGLALLYARTGALNMAQMGQALASGKLDTLVTVGFVFLVCGYLVKAAIVPFHFWLADAHAVAPAPVCILFSGVMVEMGLFALGRLYWDVFDPALHSHTRGMPVLFLAIGTITAITGAVMCYLQRNLKRLLAFSTIGHAGLMTIGFSLFTPAGLAGAAVYVLGHGVVKAGLFLVAGILLHRFACVDERILHSRGRSEKWTGLVLFAGAIGLAGLPFCGLSAGARLVNASAIDGGYGWVRWIFLGVGSVTSAAVLRAGGRIFYGWGPREQGGPPEIEEKPDTQRGHEHTPATMFVPAAVLVAVGLLLGFVPHLDRAAFTAAAHFEKAALSHPIPTDPSTGWMAVLAAIAIAGVHLFSPRMTQFFAAASKPLQILHRIHSGHIGDYVAFLTFGMACLGLICAYCFR